MATVSPRERSDEATVTSEHLSLPRSQATKFDTDSHNVDHPQVNGDVNATDDIENKLISEIVDDLVNSAEVSISGGSDNEAKSDVSKLKDGEKGHARTSSAVKKPASFKAISVNKTFLNTKGFTSTAPIKPADKVAPATTAASTTSSTLTASRPRLVVKSGSGGLVAKSSGANGQGSAPDPNAVWNKNRPAPPPPPKNYTDEELKKYGIHMANRLQTDDSKGGQSNWADIDDDDEDWAPETITWKDGTKIAIPHTEEHPPAPTPEPIPVAAPPAPAPAPAPRLVAKENGAPERPKPAPAAPVKTDVLASRKGLVLKGAPEKPTLVAKPPAPPTPVKSPWAPLPKVDKVPPVAAEAPSHAHPASKLPPKDAPMSKSVTPPPPKEIAADDFSRAPWRDGPSGAGRELYDSKSGRYEPVSDRRGSLRPDAQHGRQPALLQRSPNHEQPGPLDGTFQSGRPVELPYGRRRGSSNVSGGSGSYMHRLETRGQGLPTPELLSARQGSVGGRSDSPASPRNFSPSGMSGPRQGQAWPPKASPALSHATLHHPNGPPASAPSAHAILGHVVSEDELELQKRIMQERRELAMKRRLEEEAKEEAARKERIRLKLAALGPAPESNSAKKAAAKTPTQIQPREAAPVASPQQPTPTEEIKSVEKAPSKAPSTTAAESVKSDSTPRSLPSQPVPPAETVDMRAQPTNTHAHPWAPVPAPPERYPTTSWGSRSAAGNVWGAPNNNRSLGNGTFNTADLGPSQTAPLTSKAGPGPIAPPSSTRPTQPNAPGAVSRQPPIAPPKPVSGRLAAHERDARSAVWANSARLNEDAFNEMLNAQFAERDRQLEKEGRTIKDIQPAIKDTWRPTKIDDSGNRNETAPKQSLHLNQADSSWVGAAEPKVAQQASSVASAATSDYSQRAHSTAAGASSILAANAAPQPTRGSRFFPTRDRAETSSDAPVARSPSPPPPDMAGHPAWEGDTAHPHVSLPRPAVVVKLPPAAPTGPRAPTLEHKAVPQAPASMVQPPTFGWASQTAYREHETAPSTGGSSQNWQAKINSLLGTGTGKTVGPRSPIERPHHVGQYPASAAARSMALSADSGSATTKGPAEECFEEQEMGSLPPVRLPTKVPDMLWQPSPPPKPLPKKLYVTPTSADVISFPPGVQGNGNVWHISFPDSDFKKDIVVPFGRSRSNPRRGGSRGGRHPPSGPQGRGGKSREGGSSYSHDQGSGASGSNPPLNRNSRGGYRGGRDRDTWTRQTPIQT
ncbi:hypothetical protein OQA88_2194 [Cercophora sp. LCS_1]